MHVNLNESSLIQRKPGTVETCLDDEIVLMKLESGQCLGLGATGSAIWRLAAQPTRLAELVRDLRATYEAPEGVIEQDVTEFLTEMLDQGLIDVR